MASLTSPTTTNDNNNNHEISGSLLISKQNSLEIIVDKISLDATEINENNNNNNNNSNNGNNLVSVGDAADEFIFKTFGMKSSNRNFRSRSDIVSMKYDDDDDDVDEVKFTDLSINLSPKYGMKQSSTTKASFNENELESEVSNELVGHSSDMDSIRQQLAMMEQGNNYFHARVNSNVNKLKIKSDINDTNGDALDSIIQEAQVGSPLLEVDMTFNFDNETIKKSLNNNNKMSDDDDESSYDPTLIIHDD